MTIPTQAAMQKHRENRPMPMSAEFFIRGGRNYPQGLFWGLGESKGHFGLYFGK